MTKTKTLESLQEDIRNFLKARGWTKLQPSDLAKSITIESAELLEKFQWDTSFKKLQKKSKEDLKEIGEEAADIFVYLSEFCDVMDIDLRTAVQNKIKKNSKKYPAKMFKKGHNEKFYMSQKRKYRKERNK